MTARPHSLNIRLTTEEREALRAEARKEGVSVAALVRMRCGIGRVSEDGRRIKGRPLIDVLA